MSQNQMSTPEVGTVSGLQLSQNINAMVDTLLSNNSGPAEPDSANRRPGSFWVDTNSTPWLLKIRNSSDSDWTVIGEIDSPMFGAMTLSGDQTVAGIKTFSSSPVVPTVASSDNSTKAASTAFVQSRTVAASTSVAGLMSAADKTKLDGIESGATVGLGEGQTWQNMTASRVKGTTYYNTTGRTIFVAISGWNATVAQGVYFFTIGGVTFDLCQATGSARWHVYLPIPAGESYVLGSNISGFDYWNELR